MRARSLVRALRHGPPNDEVSVTAGSSLVEFRVDEIAFDDRGRLRRFKVTLEQHCEGGAAAARGTFDFTAS